MAKKIINVDGYIGDGGFSAQYIKNALAGADQDEVELRINSLGGDVGHAIAIKDVLEAHGNVTALYSGASASSGTLISMGCKAVKMTKDSFYLVHKPMIGIDIWASMNEDQLKDLITKLNGKLDDATKWTLQIAKMYCDKTGKPVKQILDVMKKGAWMNAEDAQKLGFVDEIITPAKITNWAEDEKLVALVAGQTDMPPLPRKATSPETPAAAGEDLASKIVLAGNDLVDKIKNLFPNHNKKAKMDKSKFALLFACLAVEAMEMQDGGVFLNQEQLDKIEARFKELEAAKTAAENALAPAKTAKETAEGSLSAAVTAMDELDATVKAAADPKAKVEAIRKKLAEKPGAAATQIQSQSDNSRKVIEGADAVTAYAQGIV